MHESHRIGRTLEGKVPLGNENKESPEKAFNHFIVQLQEARKEDIQERPISFEMSKALLQGLHKRRKDLEIKQATKLENSHDHWVSHFEQIVSEELSKLDTNIRPSASKQEVVQLEAQSVELRKRVLNKFYRDLFLVSAADFDVFIQSRRLVAQGEKYFYIPQDALLEAGLFPDEGFSKSMPKLQIPEQSRTYVLEKIEESRRLLQQLKGQRK